MDENTSFINGIMHNGIAETIGPCDVAEPSCLPYFGGGKVRDVSFDFTPHVFVCLVSQLKFE